MRLELITTGSELLLGRVTNTHQQWLGRQLADIGYSLTRQTTVPDTGDAIAAAVKEALSRSEVVLTTGGLGPTGDDLTRDAIAASLNRPLEEDRRVLEHLRHYFQRRNLVMPDAVRVQALVPQGALVLMNQFGTAPGLAIEPRSGRYLLMLPGPPRELRPMFSDQGLPWLQSTALPPRKDFSCLTLRLTGLGESEVEKRLTLRLQPLTRRGLNVGFCARPGAVDVRFVSEGVLAVELTAEAAGLARALFSDYIYGTENQSLEEVVLDLLRIAGKTLALAESCTGGFLAHSLTDVPGASEALESGLVTYTNAAKVRWAGVSENTLKQFGAVSRQTALEMAAGVREAAGADFGIGVTGIAGPAGGTDDKPVGTVFLALADRRSVKALERHFPTDRETFKRLTLREAFDWLRKELIRAKNPAD